MRSIALAALLGSVALPCAAANITVYRDQIPPVIFVDGFLEFQDAWIFKDKTEGLKKAVVKLRSRGGQISVARIGVYLGQLGLSDQAITFIVSAPPNEMK